MEDRNDLKSLHATSWKGIWFILKNRKIFQDTEFILSATIAFLTILLCLSVSIEQTFKYLSETVSLILGFFPNLFGFSLGGFAIVVGFSNNEVIKNNSNPDGFSLYQILNAVFSFCLLTQVLTTVLSFFISWFIKLDLNIFNSTPFVTTIGALINSITLGLIVFGAIYSILLTPSIILNLFSLSQVNNLFFTIQKLSENKKSLNDTNEQDKRE